MFLSLQLIRILKWILYSLRNLKSIYIETVLSVLAVDNRIEHAGQPSFVLLWYLECQIIYKTKTLPQPILLKHLLSPLWSPSLDHTFIIIIPPKGWRTEGLVIVNR